jgi:predicted ATPase
VVPVLRGVGRYYLLRGDLATAHAVAARLMMAARATDEVAFHLAGETALGVALFYAGEFEAARAHLERGLDLFAAETARQGEGAATALASTAATCAVNAALALWALGYPARSGARAEQALALARGLGEPFSVSYACHLVAGLGQWRRDSVTMQALEQGALPHDTEHGFGLLLAAGLVQRGWVLAERGQGEAALDQMRRGVAKHREIGATVLIPHSLVMVAEAYEKVGRPADGLAAVTEGLAVARQCGRHYWEAELHRLKGALTLRQGATKPHRERAEACFLQALEVARHQGARALELRAAVSLARLWAGQGKARAALALVSPIYASFTEGWDTLDLIEARRLRDALAGRADARAESIAGFRRAAGARTPR